MEDAELSTHKYLIVHADDLGMARSINSATFFALQEGYITSASVMPPCPYFDEVVQFASEGSPIDIGVHLTLTSEWKRHRWGPVASVSEVPSLVDEAGFFWRDISSLRRAKLGEVRAELEAQISKVLRVGIQPTHVDSHMFALWSTPQLQTLYSTVAKRHGMSALASTNVPEGNPRDGNRFVNVYIARRNWIPKSWYEHYVSLLDHIPIGVSQLIVHLGYDDGELQAITEGAEAWDSTWRQRDFDVITSDKFRKAIQDRDIHFVSWRDLNCRSRYNNHKPLDSRD